MYGGNLPTTGFTATIYAAVGLVLVAIGTVTALWSRVMRRV
jgi:LPXTG-motif cell wall-anchored protein